VSSSESLRWTVASREATFDQLKVDLHDEHLVTRMPLEDIYGLFGESDVVLVEVDRASAAFDFELASSAGLAVPFLLRSDTEGQFLGVCRFGLHKRVFKILSSIGHWWELRSGKGRPYEVMRKLLNRVSDGIAELDADDRVRWVNTSLMRALPSVDWEGARLENIVRADDQVRLRALREQHSEGIVVPFAVHLPNGEQADLDPSPWYDEHGKLQGTSLVFRQVHNTAEQESRANELFCLYSLATAIGQATTVEEALSVAIERTTELLGLPAGGGSVQAGNGLVTKDHSPGLDMPAAVREHFHALQSKFPRGKRAQVERVVDSESVLAQHGLNGYAVVPIEIGEERVGLIWFLAQETGRFPRETISLLISMANQLAMTIENLLYAQARLAAEADKRTFYKDALCAVTRGKLVLCEREELEASWAACGSDKGQVEITENADVPKARRFVEQALDGEGLTEEKVADAALCATEAVGNVVKHADRGSVAVRTTETTATIRIEDVGPGIDFAHLPNAVLAAGFSTAPSLGMGYSILLEMMDRVHLSTNTSGTIILLEIQKQEADPLAAFAHLMVNDF
jgi:anti-sigma regulatory factor (Ser/Thr protein kinase)